MTLSPDPSERDGARVDLWLAVPQTLPAPQLELAARLLTGEEQTRHRAFVFERHQREYLVTRGLVRTVLSRYRALAPAEWNFRRNEYGRPEIDPPCELRFNLSNHPTLIACAVRQGEREIGCDVEPLQRGNEVLSIAHTVFAPRELAELRALPASQQGDRALALWTLKEAYIKARSIGLSLPLQEFAFSFVPGSLARPAAISFTSAIDDTAERWDFTCVDVLGHRVAVAVERGARPWTLQARQLLAFDDPSAVIDLALG
jgi:4'-phosphopantetheinyl transferase